MPVHMIWCTSKIVHMPVHQDHARPCTLVHHADLHVHTRAPLVHMPGEPRAHAAPCPTGGGGGARAGARHGVKDGSVYIPHGGGMTTRCEVPNFYPNSSYPLGGERIGPAWRAAWGEAARRAARCARSSSCRCDVSRGRHHRQDGSITAAEGAQGGHLEGALCQRSSTRRLVSHRGSSADDHGKDGSGQ